MGLVFWLCRKVLHIVSMVLRLLFTRHNLRITLWTIVLVMLLGSLFVNMALEQAPSEERIRTQLGYQHFAKMTVSTRKPMTVDPFAKPKKANLLTNMNTPPVQNNHKKQGPVRTGGQNVVKQSKINKDAKTQNKPLPNIEAVNVNRSEYLIHWYNPPPYIRHRPDAQFCGFEKCDYSNCVMTFNRENATKSDAVLFDGRWVFEKAGFQRPRNQIWIFAAHEAPVTFGDLGAWWKQPQWRYGFNWTMTYDKSNTDIVLPYGTILKRKTPDLRNFKEIAKLKTKGALMINSHCRTESYREVYVEKLRKYIDIEVLGKCGKKWNCGTHYVHDKCFDLLNTTYKFFLAFENAFCRQYYSEKFFENFNYDTIIISRGGKPGNAKNLFPKGTYISTDDFASVKGFGKYLKHLSHSVNDYAKILKTKSQYYSPGYTYVYQRAMCDLCERLNNQEKYYKRIPDIVEWAYRNKPCINASDLH